MPSDSFRSEALDSKLIWVPEKWIVNVAHPFCVLGVCTFVPKLLSDNDDLWQVSMTSAKHIFWAKASIQSMMIEPFLFLKLLRLLFLCGIVPTRRCNQSFRMQQKTSNWSRNNVSLKTWTSLSFQKTWALIEKISFVVGYGRPDSAFIG